MPQELQNIRIPTLHQSSESDLHFLTRLGQKYNLLIKPAGGSLVTLPLGRGVVKHDTPEVTLTPDSVINWAYRFSKQEDIPCVTAKGYAPNTASEFHETAGGHTSGNLSLGYAFRGLYPTREAAKQAAYEKLIQKIHTFSATVIGHPWIAAESRLILSGFDPNLPQNRSQDTVIFDVQSSATAQGPLENRHGLLVTHVDGHIEDFGGNPIRKVRVRGPEISTVDLRSLLLCKVGDVDVWIAPFRNAEFCLSSSVCSVVAMPAFVLQDKR